MRDSVQRRTDVERLRSDWKKIEKDLRKATERMTNERDSKKARNLRK